ncbi:hypothetical protein J6590_073886 [Homalodisca vitripennis]|nr:hypothetical protein J6590_073886 [Homalodisca vitripennis]
MTDLLIQTASSSPPRSDSFRYGLLDGCRSPIIARYTGFEDRPSGLGLSDLKHSKSDDLVLQSAPVAAPEMHHGISDAAIQIQKEACVVYEDDISVLPSVLPKSLPVYYSDSETSNVTKCAPMEKSVLKITGDFGSDGPSRRSSRHIGLYDRLDPEDSIRDIISENDFYRFVLFKRHYEKYLDISQKYEEARNIAYYLEEKYHEIKLRGAALASDLRTNSNDHPDLKPSPKVRAKKPSLTLNLGTNGLKVTINGRAGGLLACKDRITQRSPIQAAATLDIA